MTKSSTIRILAAIGFLCLGVFPRVQAQSLAQQGTSVEDIVPQGWLNQEATGDLNKDGITDLVVVATPDYQENTMTRDDGYVYNFNQPILAIYFGTGEGQQRLWKQYDNVIPANENENCGFETSLEITSRGALRISIELFCSMGSYSTSIDRYTYRYQNGDFYLIGADFEELLRNKGDQTIISENYLTWKRQEKWYNVFQYEKDPIEKWSRLPKKPLEKLGEKRLGGQEDIGEG